MCHAYIHTPRLVAIKNTDIVGTRVVEKPPPVHVVYQLPYVDLPHEGFIFFYDSQTLLLREVRELRQ